MCQGVNISILPEASHRWKVLCQLNEAILTSNKSSSEVKVVCMVVESAADWSKKTCRKTDDSFCSTLHYTPVSPCGIPLSVRILDLHEVLSNLDQVGWRFCQSVSQHALATYSYVMPRVCEKREYFTHGFGFCWIIFWSFSRPIKNLSANVFLSFFTVNTIPELCWQEKRGFIGGSRLSQIFTMEKWIELSEN